MYTTDLSHLLGSLAAALSAPPPTPLALLAPSRKTTHILIRSRSRSLAGILPLLPHSGLSIILTTAPTVSVPADSAARSPTTFLVRVRDPRPQSVLAVVRSLAARLAAGTVPAADRPLAALVLHGWEEVSWPGWAALPSPDAAPGALDAIVDTLARTADAFGAAAVVVSAGLGQPGRCLPGTKIELDRVVVLAEQESALEADCFRIANLAGGLEGAGKFRLEWDEEAAKMKVL